MAKITLIHGPTFTAKVPVPVPGKGEVSVEFTFKHRTREEMDRFLGQVVPGPGSDAEPMDDVQMILACASGWELADPFNESTVREFASQYIAGPAAVFQTYCAELSGARAKNSDRPRS